jgi:hypothetical protein
MLRHDAKMLGGLMPGVDLSNNAALSDLLDADTPLEQLR